MGRHTVNTLQPPPPRNVHYCFITCREGPPDGPWIVHGECIDRAWMNAVWTDFASTTAGAQLTAVANGGDFPTVVADGGEVVRALLKAAMLWFCEQIRGRNDPPPVRSTIELTHTADSPWEIRLSHWYELDLGNLAPGSRAVTCFQTRFLDEDPFQETPVERAIQLVREVPVWTTDGTIPRAGLFLLHTLEGIAPTGPELPPDGGGPVPTLVPVTGMDVEEMQIERIDPLGPPDGGIPVISSMIDAARGFARRQADTVRRWFDGGGFGAAPALAGFGGLTMPIPDEEEDDARPRFEYCASPSDGGQGQLANPLPGGGRVVVLDVGQANCNAVYDAAGQIVAYYDMGWPWGTMETSRPGPPAPAYGATLPCVCARPMVILSHRDLDHYRRGLLERRVCNLKWLIPAGGAQDLVDAHGHHFQNLIARILDSGGEIIRWTNAAPVPGHMVFPWGFIERCTGTSVNGSGLAAYVCLREDPAVARAKAAAAAAAAEITPALAPFTAGLVKRIRPLAAALAGSNLGVGITPADASRASLRAVLSCYAGAAGAPAVAAHVNNAHPFGAAAVPALGVALPMAAQGMLAAAALATHGVAYPTLLARCTAIHGAVLANGAASSVGVSVLDEVAYPRPAGGGIGVGTQTALWLPGARAAVAAVATQLAAFVGVPPPNARLFAEPVAAALALYAPAVPSNAAALAALRAVIATINGAVPAVILARITDGNNLGCGAPALAVALTVDLATRTRNAAQAVVPLVALTHAGRDARDQAAANAFGLYTDTVRGAQEPAANLNVRAGAPRFAPGERYALLNGDADFGVLPSLVPANAASPLPMVVGMTAMHHGSFTEDGRFMEIARLPWAPGTAAAAAAAHANVHPNSLAQAITAVTNHLNGGAVLNLKAGVAHAGAAAAAAILVADNSLNANGQGAVANLLVGNWAAAFAAGAAAAVVGTTHGANEAGEVALAAVHAAATRIGAAYTYDFAVAARAARVFIRAPAGLLLRELRHRAVLAVACCGGALAGPPAALGAVAGIVAALAPIPPNTQGLAEPVAAAAALLLPHETAAACATAAVRAVVATLNGNGVQQASDAIWGAGALGCGCAVLPANGITAAECNEIARVAHAVEATGVAAINAGRAVNAALPAAMGGMMLFGLNQVPEIVGAAMGIGSNLNAALLAGASMRATVALLANVGDAAAVVAAMQNAVAAIGGMVPPVLPAALVNRYAYPIARAAAAVQPLLTNTYPHRRIAAEAAVWLLNQSTANEIVNAVRAVRESLATSLIGKPGFEVGSSPAVAPTALMVYGSALGSAGFAPEGFPDPTLTPNPRELVARLAQLGYAGAAAAAGVNNECNAAEGALGIAPGLAANVSAIMALSANAPWGALLADTARQAAYYAMIGEAERMSGITGARIQTAVEAEIGNTRTAAANAAVVNAPNGASVLAYSYGVMPGGHHCYTNASTLGGLGHPHPLAIAEYEARGWARRCNTSDRANHPGPQGDASPGGHASIEWNDGADTAFAVGAVALPACPTCGQQITVNR